MSSTKKRYHLRPGEVFASQEDMLITTILGSCVAVCLWDQNLGVGGMNHVILPYCPEGEVVSTRYGNIATFVLLDLMKEYGSRDQKMVARVFGGAHGIMGSAAESRWGPGQRNVEVTMDILNYLKIPVIAEDLGGESGRKIVFDLETGEIQLSYLKQYDFQAESQVIDGNSTNS